MTRLYGRAKSGERVKDYVPDVRFKRQSIPSLRMNGEMAPIVFSGTLNGDFFKVYIAYCLAPTLSSGDMVVMDNMSSHKVAGVIDPILKKGATVLFLPPYSPDFNPIEMQWSKMKTFLRKSKARTLDLLESAIATALDSVSITDISNWFKHCGYYKC
jgi:transposase